MDTIRQAISALHLGDASVYQNLAVMPLLSSRTGTADYLTLDEALSEKCVHIKELSEGGEVEQLLLTNEGDKPILLLDGEELLGAKQNRSINLTILAAARKSTIIPVSCVEQRRWDYSSEHFTTSQSVAFLRMRAEKAGQVSESLRRDRSHRSDQTKVWDSIDEKACFLRAPSDTGAMSEIFKRYDHSMDEFCQAFTITDNQVGALFAINGEIQGFEFFDATSTLEKIFPKLIRSYAIDAIEKRSDSSDKKNSADKIEIKEVKEFLQRVSNCEFESYPATGLGEDVRFSARELCGGGLINNNHVVHLCAFKIKSSDNSGRRNTYDEYTDYSNVASMLRRHAG